MTSRRTFWPRILAFVVLAALIGLSIFALFIPHMGLVPICLCAANFTNCSIGHLRIGGYIIPLMSSLCSADDIQSQCLSFFRNRQYFSYTYWIHSDRLLQEYVLLCFYAGFKVLRPKV